MGVTTRLTLLCLLTLLPFAKSILRPLRLPRHPSPSIDRLLSNSEEAIKGIQEVANRNSAVNEAWRDVIGEETPASPERCSQVYANSYVDLSKVKVLGFDYDYTIVQYNKNLLSLIYSMAMTRLTTDPGLSYPSGLASAEASTFDSAFPIRGLAVDRKTGWICQLSYTHKVSVAYEGKRKVDRERFRKEFKSKRSLTPREREKRLKPLNDLFSMAECSLVADTIEYFVANDIPFDPPSVVSDVLECIGRTHTSGDFHKIVASNPALYFEPTPRMKEVLEKMKGAGKTLLLISNSPFWYVDAGMRHILGPGWRSLFDRVVASAGKPGFYVETTRPFREVVLGEVDEDGRASESMSFEKIEAMDPSKVYSGGCLRELVRLTPALQTQEYNPSNAIQEEVASGGVLNANVLYLGDSLFADLVDAKREYGWLTAAILRELKDETTALKTDEYAATRQTIDILLSTLRITQEHMAAERSPADVEILDKLEALVSEARDRLNEILGNRRFGSIFRARHQPSLLSQSLKRYSDLYMSSVVDLADYSPEHRFYPASINSLNPHENKPSVRSKIDRIVMLGTGSGEIDDDESGDEDN